jgi:hypothetical protein
MLALSGQTFFDIRFFAIARHSNGGSDKNVIRAQLPCAIITNVHLTSCQSGIEPQRRGDTEKDY